MKENYGNIYRNARKAAGLTQERWAEFLGVSAEAVRQYESGMIMPAEDVLLSMADISGIKALPYWHLSQKSRIAAGILPELSDGKTIPEAVLALLIRLDDFREGSMKDLIRIAEDGKVTDDERRTYEHAMRQLNELIRIAYELGYARDTP